MKKKVNQLHKKELYENIYEKKFSFGKNWAAYLKKLTPKKVELAKKSLADFTKQDFKGKSFLDIGCGSGLFSLAASLLGAKVVSVDVDENSLSCARYLRAQYKIGEDEWTIKKASALDKTSLEALGEFDIVYSWGVLHHTGNMWDALQNVVSLVKEQGLLYIAIYNDFKGLPFSSKTWVKIKRVYSGSGRVLRSVIKLIYVCMLIAGITLSGRNPVKYIKEYEKSSTRGMDFFSDAEDWLGGHPYEYASVEQIDELYERQGFKRVNLKETKREGCNEFLFKKAVERQHRDAGIGIMIGNKAQRGKGLGTQAIKILANYAFKRLNLNRLTAYIYENNKGSARAFEKAGFVEEGVRRKAKFCNGSYCGEKIFGLLREDVKG